MLKDIVSFDKRWLEFTLAMTEKEIKARYKHAFFGFLWAFLNPVFQMLIIGFVFSFFVPVKVDNYFIFIFSGLLPWNFFSQTLSKCIPSIVYERSLIEKSNFPRESIIFSIVLSNLFHLVISLGLFILYLFIFNSGLVSVGGLFAVLIGVFLLVVFTTGLSLLFSSLNAKYRDVNFFIQAILPLWFYATPIIYTLNLIPEPFRQFLYLNPMTMVLDAFHLGVKMSQEVPEYIYAINIFVVVLIFFLGLSVFKKQSKFFDDWI